MRRHLNRSPSHRNALIKNLITSLIDKEAIVTTYAKAKEAQKFAERVIGLVRRPNVEMARRVAQSKTLQHGRILPKLFGELAERYKNRAGGFTRVMHLEPRLGDNAPQALLELVDGPKEYKLFLTARTVARLETQGLPVDEKTQRAIEKLVKGRPNGQETFREAVQAMKDAFYNPETCSEEVKRSLATNFPPPPKPEKPKNYVMIPRPKKTAPADEA